MEGKIFYLILDQIINMKIYIGEESEKSYTFWLI